mgnify:CR=1 FL=1
MEYKFFNTKFDVENTNLPSSDKINPILLKNNYSDIIKGINFISSDEKLLYIHGFLGTGKRQYINYITDFLDKEVIKLEYYCKPSTVCDDILLLFINKIENINSNKTLNFNAKITVLNVKFQQYISSIKKPFLIILHSADGIEEENLKLVTTLIENTAKNNNVKFIISTRAMLPGIAGNTKIDKKIFLKALTKENFKLFLDNNKIEYNDNFLEKFYTYTRGYYYYTALACKIIPAMKLSLNEFLEKFTLSGMTFDAYLGASYVNLIPNTIRNFFWFLRTVRHGLSLNALAVLDLYDEFSVEYLKTNLMIFVADETVYVQDYFQQNIDISIPQKTEIKLHKYIIGIYEKQLKEPLQTREILLSRQALRSEIEYHNRCINNITENKNPAKEVTEEKNPDNKNTAASVNRDQKIEELILNAEKEVENNNPTKAIELYSNIIDKETIDSRTLTDVRHQLARLYKEIGEYNKSQHYYELVEKYYFHNKEVINLNYLYYELTELYYIMYKNERAVETIKKVIYSVDTPQSLMVDACTLLGNIYNDNNNGENAYTYYQKAIDSLDENTSDETLAELYFKFGLVNDEKDNTQTAIDYYNKCITVGKNNLYKASAYSNLGSCYLENKNFADAETCFLEAYKIEKASNNYDGIFYTANYLAKIYINLNSPKALDYLIEAKQSAEFVNENLYILEASIALGDYYYNDITANTKALTEYFQAKKVAMNMGSAVDITKIENRIEDMRLRMDKTDFEQIERKYG